MNYSSRILLVNLLAFGFNFSFSQPEWVKTNGKSSRYPEQIYLTGFGISKLGKDENRGNCTNMAIDNARRNLVEKIRVTIQNTVTSAREEKENKYSEYFSAIIQTSSTLEIQGLENDNYYDDASQMCYAFVYVNREKLLKVYAEKVVTLRKEIHDRIKTGNSYEDKGEKTKARNEYLACYSLFEKLEEAQAVLTASQLSSIVETLMSELDTVVSKDEISRVKINEAVNRLLQKPVKNPEDLAWFIVHCLKEQIPSGDISVLVTPFTYRDTKMGSPFARFFKPVLEDKIIELAKWNVVQQAINVQPKTHNIACEFAEASGAQFIIRGNYWENSGGFKFIVHLYNIARNLISASVTASIDSSILTNWHYSLQPENFARAFSDQKVFKADEMINSGLNVEIWTNKGNDAVVYSKGEKMKVYVRVNRECYLRLIYHLADGKRTLLLSNYFIDMNKANQVVEIPAEFECDAPYGAEVLQAFTQTEPFEQVQTVNVDGYDILKEDLKKIVAATRGMKRVKPSLMQAEGRVVVTTLGK